MKVQIPELRITGDGSHTLFVPVLNEHYHSVHGAIRESAHIFIGNGLDLIEKSPVRILEIGFGTGLNAFLTALDCMRNKRPSFYYTIEKYPLNRKIISELNYPEKITGGDRHLFEAIHNSSWDMENRINDFFHLKKISSDLLNFDIHDEYDLVYYDAFAPEVQPELWSEKVISSVASHIAEKGIFITYSAKGELKRILQRAGFIVINPTGPPGKRQITRAMKQSG